jgi:hypothetical protein
VITEAAILDSIGALEEALGDAVRARNAAA